jgi:hypothetical protein
MIFILCILISLKIFVKCFSKTRQNCHVINSPPPFPSLSLPDSISSSLSSLHRSSQPRPGGGDTKLMSKYKHSKAQPDPSRTTRAVRSPSSSCQSQGMVADRVAVRTGTRGHRELLTPHCLARTTRFPPLSHLIRPLLVLLVPCAWPAVHCLEALMLWSRNNAKAGKTPCRGIALDIAMKVVW